MVAQLAGGAGFKNQWEKSPCEFKSRPQHQKVEWRNWQTQRLERPLGHKYPCEFNSRLDHQTGMFSERMARCAESGEGRRL